MIQLTVHELRVLGALIEKQVATPEYYPLTLNALVNACNQRNHRDPVVSYGEAEVKKAVESLRDKRLATAFDGATSRVIKYSHNFAQALELDAPAVAVMCVMVLRGPQTPGELRSRTTHLHNFESLGAVDEVLAQLQSMSEPLVVKLPRQPGTKEARFMHLLGGPIAVAAEAPAAETAAFSENTTATNEEGRLAALEAKVAALQSDVDALKLQLEAIKQS